MSNTRLALMIIPTAIGATIGTITAINNEITTLRRYNFRVVPDIFQIGARISLGTGTGAMCGLLWPVYGGLLAYNFIDNISRLN